MIKFSNDTDIVRYEPVLFGELHLANQVLAQGNGGVIDGVTFTADGADFVNASVEAGGVVYLRSPDGNVDGVFEIISVDSAEQLTVSVVRANGDEDLIALSATEEVYYRICTYRPQVSEVAIQLTEHFGIRPGDATSEIDVSNIMDKTVLRRASVFAVISVLYAMLASKGDGDNFWKKSLYYKKLFEKARQSCRISIDRNGDGIADMDKRGNVLNLVRE